METKSNSKACSFCSEEPQKGTSCLESSKTPKAIICNKCLAKAKYLVDNTSKSVIPIGDYLTKLKQKDDK